MTSTADNSTVVGDLDYTLRKGPSENNKAGKRRLEPESVKSNLESFVLTNDYALEDQPFFVPIGKDGLLAALQKLNKQLVHVSLAIQSLINDVMLCSRAEPDCSPRKFLQTGLAKKSLLVNWV